MIFEERMVGTVGFESATDGFSQIFLNKCLRL